MKHDRRWRLAAAVIVLGAVAGLGALVVHCGAAPSPRQPPIAAASAWSFGVLPPGAQPFDAALAARLQHAWDTRPSDYRPRTRHLLDDGRPKYTNRLFLESSPYLRQHAHNPVNWFPWGDEAFALAKALGRPVLLSVGYSTCHWCHVMEEESFEDEAIARYINENYVAIKVDREERPDVDSIYMTAVRVISGGGGWPMTVWLTADRKPFYGGTYFPARDGDRGSRKGFLTLLRELRAMFDQSGDRVAASAAEVAAKIRTQLGGRHGGAVPGGAALRALVDGYAGGFDDTYGGFARAPKFPSSLSVRALLRYHRRTGDARALKMATLTLEKMAAGGMYDHAGGGFHRYSTDRRWLVPHFEKMLYDNALLCVAYLEGYQATGRDDFARVAREILRYVERDMTSPEGAFYSATDADSPTPSGKREEGWFFTWTPAEIARALPAERARAVTAYYGVTEGGNFERRNILHTPRPLDEVAAELGTSPAALWADISAARERLYELRKRRPPPLRDEKILAAWNGLMIAAHARAALALGEPRHAARAARAADFVLKRMTKQGRLLRSYKDGRAGNNGYLDDYAFVIGGLLDLFEASHESRWLAEARRLAAVVERHYVDRAAGGYFLTSDDHEALLAREKPAYDGAEPSGSSVHAMNLLRLYQLTDDERFRKSALRTLAAVGQVLSSRPAALSEMMLRSTSTSTPPSRS